MQDDILNLAVYLDHHLWLTNDLDLQILKQRTHGLNNHKATTGGRSGELTFSFIKEHEHARPLRKLIYSNGPASFWGGRDMKAKRAA